jgi:hypothetical protein
MNKQCSESFWLWTLGITDQYLHSKINSQSYENELSELIKAHFDVSKGNRSAEAEEDVEDGQEKKFDSKGLFYKKITLETDNKDVGHIFQNNEYRFMLLRDWNLLDAISNSNYVCS